MSIIEKIKQKAKLMEDDELPSCWEKFVLLDDVLKILKGYNIKPRLEEWEEGVAEAFSKKSRLIIIEGVDGTGKTTLIKGLKKEVWPDYLFNYAKPLGCTIFQEASYAEGEYIRSIKIFKQLIEKGKIIICDRFHLGEYAYGPVKRGYPSWLGEELVKRVEDFLLTTIKKEKIKLILLGFADYQMAKGRLKKIEYLDNLEEVNKVNKLYQEAFILSKLPKWFIYTDIRSEKETLVEAVNFVSI